MRHKTKRDSGAILIIAIGILTLLAILGATFANLMRLEKQATNNFIDAQTVDLINDSALDRVIAELRGADNWRSFTPYRVPWLYKLLKVDDLAHGLEPLESDSVGEWETLSQKQKELHRYKVKVIDTSAQINLNGKQDTLHRMLDHLGLAIKGSTRLKSPPNPLNTEANNGGQLLKGLSIIQFRNKLEGNRFRSKTQLRELIGRENFELIKDFVTVESFVDPYTYVASDGHDEVIEQGQSNVSGGGRGIGGGGAAVAQPPVERLSAALSPEPRSPININTAPEEVLIACLWGIAARRPFPFARITYQAIDEGSTETSGQRPIGKEEKDNATPRAVWVYSDRQGEGIDYNGARQLAQRIIAQRKTVPFMCWSTGEKSIPGGFAEFINDLETSFFPSPERAVVVDPRLPRDGRIDGEVRGGSLPEMSKLWQKGHIGQERTFREQKGLPFHTQFAFYYEMVKAAIIANANPNTRINRYNPNVPAYTAVDKSDLVRIENDGNRTPRKGHTTEFCFDTNGVYEVTTLGQIATPSLSASGGVPDYRPVYQKPMRTVVKVFDVLRHTNQFHFEHTFSAGDRSSRSNRRGVQTCPDPMAALTDAAAAGSRRDGYVQLAGLLDGRRLLQPPASRSAALRSPASIIMAHPFQDRDDPSYAQLRRLNQSGGRQYTEELRKVLDAGYSRKGQRFREQYTVEELQTLGVQAGGGVFRQPNVGDEEGTGSDLLPDGYHQSMFRSSHLGGRFVILPGHERIGQSAKGGPGLQVGAGLRQNIGANLAYYEGGIAFWVKFEFNGDDPVFSGLVGFTQVIEDVGMQPKDTEGTQFYIWRNTEGSLRIARLHYHQAFPELGGEGGGSAGALWPPVGGGDEGGADGGGAPGAGENPIIQELDPKKIWARADILSPPDAMRHFRAHEWHHIAIEWNDQNAANALQVYVDFQRQQGWGPYVRPAVQGEKPTAWVRLNCRRPRDELFIGGFVRTQQVADGGLFKWNTCVADPAGTAGGGVQPIAPSVKRILANATIDEFISFENGFQGVRNYYTGGGGAPGYFYNQTGTYANVFEVPLPPEVDYVMMRSFDWTSYYPSFFRSVEGGALNIISTPIQCQVFPGRENVPVLSEPWRPAVRAGVNQVANKRLQRRQSKGLLGMNAELVYQFSIPPGKVQAGPLAGGAVQTPIIDDVTLTYYLTDPKILLQEEAEERLPQPQIAGGYRR